MVLAIGDRKLKIRRKSSEPSIINIRSQTEDSLLDNKENRSNCNVDHEKLFLCSNLF